MIESVELGEQIQQKFGSVRAEEQDRKRNRLMRYVEKSGEVCGCPEASTSGEDA